MPSQSLPIRLVATSAILALLASPALSQATPKPEPSSVERAATAVIAAIQSDDAQALSALAKASEPSPWTVAEELIRRREHDAAAALAKVVSGEDLEGLPRYVASSREAPAEQALHDAVAAANRSFAAKDPKSALAALEAVDPKSKTVTSVRVIFGRGSALRSLNRHKEGVRVFHTAADLAEEIGWSSRASKALQRAGTAELMISELGGAMRTFKRKLALDRARGANVDVAESLSLIAAVFMRRSAYARAVTTLRRALSLYEKAGDRRGMATCLRSIAGAHTRLFQHREALAVLERGMKIAEEEGDAKLLAAFLNSAGLLHIYKGERAKALDYFERVVAENEKLGDRHNLAIAIRNVGNTLLELGRYPRAIRTLERALRVSRENGSVQSTTVTLMLLGTANRRTGNYEAALARLHEARRILEPTSDRKGLAMTFQRLGATHRDRGDYAASAASMRKALEHAKALGSALMTAQAEGGLGLALVSLGSLIDARRHIQRAIQLSEQVGSAAQLGVQLGSMGILHMARGDRLQARACFERALAIMERLGARPSIAIQLDNLGTTYDGRKGLEFHRRALAMKQSIGDRWGVAAAHHNIGSTLLQLGEHEQALASFDRLMKIARELGQREFVAKALREMSKAHSDRGDYRKSIEYVTRAVTIFRELGDRFSAATSEGLLSDYHRCLGELDEALACEKRMAEESEQLGGRVGVGLVLGLASHHKTRGDPNEALGHAERALELAKQLGNRRVLATAHSQLGLIYDDLTAFAKALRHLELAKKIYEELGIERRAATDLMRIANIHNQLGDETRALAMYERCLAMYERLGLVTVHALENIGRCHGRLGNRAKALEYLGRVLKYHEEARVGQNIARAHLAIAATELGSGEYGKVIEHGGRARALFAEIGDSVGMARVDLVVGAAHRHRGDVERAVTLFGRSRRAARDTGVADLEAFASSGLASALTRLGRHEEAAAVAKAGVERLPFVVAGLGEEQAAMARSRYTDLFRVGLQACVAREDQAGATFFIESGRAGALLESLGGRDRLSARLPDELRDEVGAARAAAAAAQTYLRGAIQRKKRKEIRAARGTLEKANENLLGAIERMQRASKMAANVSYPQAASLEQIMSTLGADETLVAYAVLGKKLTALVVTEEGARLVAGLDRPNAAPFADAKTPFADATDSLRKALIAPLGLAETAKRILISPGGALAYVPFSVLLPDREVVYVQSGTTYRVLQDEREKRGDRILAIGDPRYGAKQGATRSSSFYGELTRLPGTKVEAETVGDVVLIGAEASEPEFARVIGKEKRWRAVHFACHGIVNSEQPQLSALALTPDGESDGFLTMHEVVSARIPADLVVLSACETGQGKVYGGEGVVGFTQAFMLAGAPRVMVSLWKVDDEATRALMIEFYERWKTKPAATALQEAQAFVRDHEKWRHPYYWGAWQLWGLPD